MDDVSKNLNKFINSTLDKAILSGLEHIGQAIENDAVDECPVSPGGGIMRAKLTHEVNKVEKKVTIGSNMEYAPYVHEGTGIYAVNGNGRKDVPWHYKDAKGEWHHTKGQKPNPFLKRAVEKNKPTILQTFGEGASIEWKK